MASDKNSSSVQPAGSSAAAEHEGNGSIEIRRVRADESAAVRDIRVRCLTDSPEAFAATLEETRGRPQEHWVTRAVEGSSGDDAAIFVAVQPVGGADPERWMGVVMGYQETTEPNGAELAGVISLVSMWTDPVARGQGVGRELVQALLDWAGGTEAQMVELWVMQDNPGAQKLYEAKGFAASSNPRTDPGEVCQEEICMQLTLSRS